MGASGVVLQLVDLGCVWSSKWKVRGAEGGGVVGRVLFVVRGVLIFPAGIVVVC